jgi:hypothetical protein
VSTSPVVTTVPGDLLVGYCVADWSCNLGAGFTARSTFHSNLIEDASASVPGTYTATATANNGWTMQLVALKPAAPAGSGK